MLKEITSEEILAISFVCSFLVLHGGISGTEMGNAVIERILKNGEYKSEFVGELEEALTGAYDCMKAADESPHIQEIIQAIINRSRSLARNGE